MIIVALLLWMVLAVHVPPVLAHADESAGGLHLERLDTGAGAELLTFVSVQAGLRNPVLSILRDTLGDDDPSNDRIRYIWVLTYAPPSFQQRIKASLPFFYRNSGKAPVKDQPPKPILDFSGAGHRVFAGVLGKLVQRSFLDSNGIWSRATTRSYKGNAGEYRNTQISRSLEVLNSPGAKGEFPGLTQKELDRIKGKLILTQRLFGDLTSESYLGIAAERHGLRRNTTRAANWELLRQKAEENDLYFQPLRLGAQEENYVLLWVARETLAQPHGAFDERLLQMRPPWNDKRVTSIGYSETWHFDDQGRRTDGGSAASRSVEVIPLGLYSLNHPKVPLLMVDFRDRGRVRRSEVQRRALDETTGALSLPLFSAWTYLGARSAWTFLRGRWGAPVNREARLRAYSNLRYALAVDDSLDSRLQALVAESVERLSVNPVDRSLEEEAKLARKQHEALVVWALAPDGLAAGLDRDRRAEMVPATHGRTVRGVLTLARIASAGLYRHLEQPDPDRLGRLDRRRRIDYHAGWLRALLESSPKPEVVASVRDIEESLRVLSALTSQDTYEVKRIAKLVSRLFRQTGEEGLRRQCLDSLATMRHEEAENELAKLMSDPAIAAWRRSMQQQAAAPGVAGESVQSRNETEEQ